MVATTSHRWKHHETEKMSIRGWPECSIFRAFSLFLLAFACKDSESSNGRGGRDRLKPYLKVFKNLSNMSDFRDCVSEIEVDDISMSGLNFTWNKSPGKVGGLLKKLDRVMGNVAFMTSFPTSFAHFLPFMTSDHTPVVFAIHEVAKAKPKPFKFHNYLTSKDGFIPAVKKVWVSDVDGFSMFSLVSKLNMLKKPLRKLNFDQGNLFANVERLRHELSSIQAAMVSNPHSGELWESELLCLKSFKAALKDEELFLRQKSKIEWLSEGDNNSKYFNNVVKGIINRGKSSKVWPINKSDVLFSNKLSKGDALYMIRDVSGDEFFKDAWGVIGKEFCKAVKDFFISGKLLKEYVTVLKNSLDEFGSVSCLFLSFPKSMVYFGNVKDFSKAKILKVMPFSEGKLSVRYLGVPLLSKRLYVNDYSALVNEVKKMILDWKNKTLSFAGRLHLILSVVGSMQVYWFSMFILPITISNDVERLMRDFLWNYGDFKRGKARIKWSDVCKPKVEGGLGIKFFKTWNIALISKHIWNIINKKDSLWVKWVHLYKLKGRSFWDVPEKEGSS
ncbi:hypothetical protein Tco_1493313 [Tanacetum coccineum]